MLAFSLPCTKACWMHKEAYLVVERSSFVASCQIVSSNYTHTIKFLPTKRIFNLTKIVKYTNATNRRRSVFIRIAYKHTHTKKKRSKCVHKSVGIMNFCSNGKCNSRKFQIRSHFSVVVAADMCVCVSSFTHYINCAWNRKCIVL